MSPSVLTHICDSAAVRLKLYWKLNALLTVADRWNSIKRGRLWLATGSMWLVGALWHQQQLAHTCFLFISRVRRGEYYYWVIKSVCSCMTDAAHEVERATVACQLKNDKKHWDIWRSCATSSVDNETGFSLFKPLKIAQNSLGSITVQQRVTHHVLNHVWFTQPFTVFLFSTVYNVLMIFWLNKCS